MNYNIQHSVNCVVGFLFKISETMENLSTFLEASSIYVNSGVKISTPKLNLNDKNSFSSLLKSQKICFMLSINMKPNLHF
jgi:hypothetical protein